MFIVERRDAARTRKYQWAMVLIFTLLGSLGSVLTMHFAVAPKQTETQRPSRPASASISLNRVAIVLAVLLLVLFLLASKNDLLWLLNGR